MTLMANSEKIDNCDQSLITLSLQSLTFR